MAAFHRGLSDTGLQEGRNLAVEYRFADNAVEKVPPLAKDLVERSPVAIAAFTTVAARALKAATATTPVVFVTGDDPVAAGLVARIDRPEANLTGISFISATLGSKRLELLRALIPAGLIAVLVDQNNSESRTMAQDIGLLAKSTGQDIPPINVGTEKEIEAAFRAMVDRQVRGFLLTGSAFTNARMHTFVRFAAQTRIAGIYTNRDIVAAGGLISYGTSLTDAYHQAGLYIGRIVRGELVANLPVLLPRKFELAININTAKSLDLTIPPLLLAIADEVIE